MFKKGDSMKTRSGYWGDGKIHDDITVIQSKINREVELHVFNDKSGCYFSLIGVILSEYDLKERGYTDAVNEIKPKGYDILGWTL